MAHGIQLLKYPKLLDKAFKKGIYIGNMSNIVQRYLRD